MQRLSVFDPSGPITEEIVDDLRSQMRKMTKMYRSLEVPDDRHDERVHQKVQRQIRKVADLFWKFERSVREWLDSQYRLRQDAAEGDETAQDVYDTFEDFRSKGLYRNRMFPTYREDRTEKYKINTIVRNRKKNIRRYQRYWRKFYKSLQRYIDKKGGEVPGTPVDNQYNVNGTSVVIKQEGRGERETGEYAVDLEDNIREFMDAVREAQRQMDGADLEEAYRGAVLRVFPAKSDPQRARARYLGDDVVVVWESVLVKNEPSVLVHELGHRHFYENISEGDRQHFRDAVENSSMEITSDHIKRFVANVAFTEIGYERKREEERYEHLTPRDLKKQLEVLAREEFEQTKSHLTYDTRAAFGYLVEEGNLKRLMRMEPPEAISYLEGEHLGEEVHFEFITDYARDDTSEAYAEAFKLYVTKGPRSLGKWTRQLFEDVTFSEQRRSSSSITSRVARRVFQKIRK